MNRALKLAGLVLAVFLLAACGAERRPSDAELGLDTVQIAGRRIYERQCGYCHRAYSSKSLKGPSLQGVFKRQYLRMGAPANEDRVRDIIVNGRAKMPGYARVLSDEQVAQVIAYLRTL